MPDRLNILAVSDYPVFFRNGRIQTEGIGRVDLVLSCGDLAREYLSALSRTFKAPLYFVKGNHDIRDDTSALDGCVDIHMNLIRFRDINILGFEGSHWYNGGPHQYTERGMKRMVRSLTSGLRKRNGVDIIISHAAPRYIHDGEDQCHLGFKVFRWLINKYNPSWFFHGHLHEHFPDPADRVTRVHGTRVVNCCGYYYMEYPGEKLPG